MTVGRKILYTFTTVTVDVLVLLSGNGSALLLYGLNPAWFVSWSPTGAESATRTVTIRSFHHPGPNCPLFQVRSWTVGSVASGPRSQKNRPNPQSRCWALTNSKPAGNVSVMVVGSDPHWLGRLAK